MNNNQIYQTGCIICIIYILHVCIILASKTVSKMKSSNQFFESVMTVLIYYSESINFNFHLVIKIRIRNMKNESTSDIRPLLLFRENICLNLQRFIITLSECLLIICIDSLFICFSFF